MSQKIAEKIQAEFGEDVTGLSNRQIDVRKTPIDQWTVEINRDRVVDILSFARDTLSMSFLSDITAVDYLQMFKPERFAVIYILRNLTDNSEIIIKAYVPEDEPEIDSACDVYKGANWLEREVFDMFGIIFKNHPNLIRLLTPEDFDGNPLRKDYPVEGRGYRDKFRVITRDAG